MKEQNWTCPRCVATPRPPLLAAAQGKFEVIDIEEKEEKSHLIECKQKWSKQDAVSKTTEENAGKTTYRA